jgi:hypothetical protein
MRSYASVPAGQVEAAEQVSSGLHLSIRWGPVCRHSTLTAAALFSLILWLFLQPIRVPRQPSMLHMPRPGGTDGATRCATLLQSTPTPREVVPQHLQD